MTPFFTKRPDTWVAVVGLLGALSLSGCGSLFSASKSSSGLVFPDHADHMRPAAPLQGGDFIDRVSVNPFDPVALNNLAIAEAAKGRYQQALMLLQRAVKLAPARPDIAANLQSLQRWLTLAEGQAAIGLAPQPLALPYQDSLVPEVPPLWQPPPAVGLPQQGLRGNGPTALTSPPPVLPYTPATSPAKPATNAKLPARPLQNSK
ncbi:MAG: hypothetical protein RLZZ612_1466 [Pseudomonadota bacterium]